MFLSRLKLDPKSSQVARDLRDVNALHQRVLQGFPRSVSPARPRAELGVLFRLDRTGDGRLLLLVQSSAPPDWTSLPPGYLLAPTGFDDEAPNPSIKVLDDALAALRPGQPLRFRLRANPTRKVDTKTGPDGKRRNGRRVGLKTAEERLAWLRRKGEQHGFRVIEAEFSNGERAAAVQDLSEGRATGQRLAPDGVGRAPVTFSSTVYEGVLQITDLAAFGAAVLGGIGSGKAFGFGLLSIAPAG